MSPLFGELSSCIVIAIHEESCPFLHLTSQNSVSFIIHLQSMRLSNDLLRERAALLGFAHSSAKILVCRCNRCVLKGGLQRWVLTWWRRWLQNASHVYLQQLHIDVSASARYLLIGTRRNPLFSTPGYWTHLP